MLGLIASSMALAANYDPTTQMNGAYMFANMVEGGAQAVHRGDGFVDTYSQLYTSVYGQVNWVGVNTPLPSEFVKAWDEKTINIVGFEFDAIRGPSITEPCVNNVTAISTCKETRVPAWEQYNHHFGNSVSGKGTTMVKDPRKKFAHEFDPVKHMYGFDGYMFVDEASGEEVTNFGAGSHKGALSSTGGMPMGNGAEARKTFHFFPPGFGAQVKSPTNCNLGPMFIDTKNRWTADTWGGTGGSNPAYNPMRPTGHGPMPKNANVPSTEMYSGMMECPCSDRYTSRRLFSEASTLQAGLCVDPKTKKPALQANASSCFEAAVSLGMTPAKQNLTVNTMTAPKGCFATAVAGGFEISFNTAESKAACGAKNGTKTRVVGSVDAVAPPGGDGVAFDLSIDSAADLVTLTIVGPATKWFGIGFGLQTMDGVCVGACPPVVGVNAIIFDSTGTTFEQKLGMHAVGTKIAAPIHKVISNKVAAGMRTVTITRPMKGANSVNSFVDNMGKSDYITAVGPAAWTGDAQGYHRYKSSGTVYFADVSAPTCLCTVGADEGTLGGFAWGGQHCNPRPLGQMLDDPGWNSATGRGGVGNSTDWPSWNNNSVNTNWHGENPTCNLKAYRGGLKCCHGHDYIVDTDMLTKILAEQKNNTPGAMDYFQMKFRWYYEDATKVYDGLPTVDTKINIGWYTENGNGEHDVPPCDPSRDRVEGLGDCVYNISSNFTGMNWPHSGTTPGSEVELIHVEGHCHIGCYGMQLWNMTDAKNPYIFCQTWNDYGTGDEIHNEMGYLLGNRPCIFGNPKDGYELPPIVRPTDKIMSVKIQNNTHPRYGDMGLWEIKAALKPAGREW